MSAITKRILHELEHHIPFTLFGAFTGIALILVLIFTESLNGIEANEETIFFILHPAHVLLSAIATTALYLKYSKKNILLAVLIGFTGSIVIATISDSIIPYIGELLLGLPNAEAHIGIIDKPIITLVPAFIGIAIGYFITHSKIPHAGHVLISTWASLFHVLMALGSTVNFIQIIGIFVFLFLAVWLPCCTSDIIYPLVFSKKEKKIN